MSAPNTDVEKQEKEHKPALLGIKGAIIVAVLLLLGLITWLAAKGQEPVTPETRIDARTGAEVETQ
ncbi:hypothetical protein HAT86_06490 [Roseovarius gahaiensis]|uniref:Uncharacterized protein n=1 Tax=Roseovarius gahaiensis TaxID=2716691 RepID=A0A967BD94_9RHOB|nr:hypothetical protein [Roseovarius gahaiensis]NHQ74114.1 hypothetical protein [Roseovarius gahaiensis]